MSSALGFQSSSGLRSALNSSYASGGLASCRRWHSKPTNGLDFGFAGFDIANSQDNPCLSLTTAEKLRALKSSKDAWAFLCPDFTTSIAVTHNQSGVYDLTWGVYLLSNSMRTALEMYAKAEDGESDIVETMQAAPSTGDILPGPLPERAIADSVAEDDFGPDVENSRSRNLVPWSQWGPAVTRWFNSDNVSAHCYHFVVLDFNPVNVKKMQLWLKE